LKKHQKGYDISITKQKQTNWQKMQCNINLQQDYKET
jgi:hypothetical protein